MAKRQETQFGLTFGWKPGDGSGAAQTPNWHIIAGLLQPSVISIESTLPGSPAQDAKYLVAASGTTGIAVGNENSIAWNDDGVWRFFPARVGYHTWVQSENKRANFTTEWVLEGSADIAKTLVTVSRVNNDSVPITKGMVVCMSAGMFKRGLATDPYLSQVVGLAFDDTILVGGSGRACSSGVVAQTTGAWDMLTGDTGGLIVDQTYFLDVVAGGLTIDSPPDVSGNVVYPLGVALSPTEFLVDLGTPIDL